MADAVIVAAARTPIGRACKGTLVDVNAVELTRTVVASVIDRAGVRPRPSGPGACQ